MSYWSDDDRSALVELRNEDERRLQKKRMEEVVQEGWGSLGWDEEAYVD